MIVREGVPARKSAIAAPERIECVPISEAAKPRESAPITVAAALSLVLMRLEVISMSFGDEWDCWVMLTLVSAVEEG